MKNESNIPHDKNREQPLQRKPTTSASFLGWFLGTLSALTLISVFYIGDLISTGLHQVLNYRELSSKLQEAERPDRILNVQTLAGLPAAQSRLVERAAGIYALLEKGDFKRAQQILSSDQLPTTPGKYKLGAVLTWVAENNENVSRYEAAKATAENRRRALVLEHGSILEEASENHGDAGEAGCADCGGLESLEQTALAEYRQAVLEIDEHEQLIQQANAREADLERMALERARALLAELARPAFDEITITAYREAAAQAERLGVSLPSAEL